MNDTEKKSQLQKYKMFATGLFVLMAAVFVLMTILGKKNPAHWIGYIRAFSEAAMVGALADWFAVTALFHHPLGLKIPHTNLIEKSKEKIGDNLGNFVVGNFLSAQNIRPYIQKLQVSGMAGKWLAQPAHQQTLVRELSVIARDIIIKLDERQVTGFITQKLHEFSDNVEINQILGNGLEYIVEKNDHQKLITNLAGQIKNYILNNEDMVKERVQKESYFLIPKFVDNSIAEKISSGLSGYFSEVEEDGAHPLRKEISAKLLQFAQEMKTSKQWKENVDTLKNDFLGSEKLQKYAADIWISVRTSVLKELETEQSALKQYITKNLDALAANLQTDVVLQQKIDGWIRSTAYKYILKNTHQFGELISSTVGNWEGKELSEKLELEVGKDLQFIRVNGTLVGGLVGLIIYTVANFFI